MATVSTMRLTKPRISALILETTAAIVSVVVVVWLLLWFINQRAHKNQIEAFYVRIDGVQPEDASPPGSGCTAFLRRASRADARGRAYRKSPGMYQTPGPSRHLRLSTCHRNRPGGGTHS